jgi:hypothetical protein
MNKKTLFTSITCLLFACIVQACGPSAPEYPADVVRLRQMEEISEGGQTVSARPDHTFILVGFDVPDCQSITTFFYGTGPDGYIVDKDFSKMVLSDVFCDKIGKLRLVDAAGKEYYPLGFVPEKLVIFEVETSAENLIVKMNDDILLPLIGDPNAGKVEASIKVPYCDEAIAGGQITGGNYLCMTSEADDYVGAGKNWLFTAGDSKFNTIGPGTLTIFVNDGDWGLDFLPAKQTPGKPGLYDEAVRTTAALQGGTNGMDVYGDGRGCNEVTGKFEVLDIKWRVDNVMTRLYVNFEQHCDGKGPALYGYLRYDAP